MDDRHAEFLIIVADIFLGAALGGLTIEIETVQGTRITGTFPADLGDSASWVDDINSRSTVRIDEREVLFADIAACRVHAPPRPPRPSPAAPLGPDS